MAWTLPDAQQQAQKIVTISEPLLKHCYVLDMGTNFLHIFLWAGATLQHDNIQMVTCDKL